MAKDEITKGLTVMAFYFQSNLGVPVDVFEDWLDEHCPTLAHSHLLYVNFKAAHPELYG